MSESLAIIRLDGEEEPNGAPASAEEIINELSRAVCDRSESGDSKCEGLRFKMLAREGAGIIGM